MGIPKSKEIGDGEFSEFAQGAGNKDGRDGESKNGSAEQGQRSRDALLVSQAHDTNNGAPARQGGHDGHGVGPSADASAGNPILLPGAQDPSRSQNPDEDTTDQVGDDECPFQGHREP